MVLDRFSLSTEILTNASRIATICVVLQDDFGNYDGGDFGPEGDGLYGQVKYDEIPNKHGKNIKIIKLSNDYVEQEDENIQCIKCKF